MLSGLGNFFSSVKFMNKEWNRSSGVLLISIAMTLVSLYYLTDWQNQERQVQTALDAAGRVLALQPDSAMHSENTGVILRPVAESELVDQVCILDSSRKVLYFLHDKSTRVNSSNPLDRMFSENNTTGNWRLIPVHSASESEQYYLAVHYTNSQLTVWVFAAVFLCSLLAGAAALLYLRRQINKQFETLLYNIVQPLQQAHQLPLEQVSAAAGNSPQLVPFIAAVNETYGKINTIIAGEYYPRKELVSILSGLDDLVLVFDDSLRIVEANIPEQVIPRSSGTGIRDLSLTSILPQAVAAQVDEVISDSIKHHERNRIDFALGEGTEKTWWSAIIIPGSSTGGVNSGAMLIARNITQERIHEQIIHDQKEVLHSFFRQSADGLMIVNPEGIITEWNTAMARLTGMSDKEVLGKPAWVVQYQVLPEDSKKQTSEEQIRQQVLALLNSKENAITYPPYERRMLTAQGEELNINTTMFPIHTSGGIYLGVTIRDITQKHLFQKAVEEKAHYLQMIIDAAPFGAHVWKLFEDGTVKFMASNKSADLILSIQHGELYGKTVEELNAAGKAAAPKEYIVDVIKNQLTIHIPSFRPKMEGYDGLLEVHSVCVSSSEAAFFFRDITEKQKAEQALTSANEFIQQVINSIPAAIISIDSGANVLLYNASACAFLSQELEMRNEKQLFSLFPLLQFAKPVLEKAIVLQELAHETLEVPDIEERLKYYHVNVLPLGGNSNGGYLFVIDDITKDKVLDQYIIQSEKLASLGSMAAGMAHELNNPLGTIVQGCQNILRRVSTEIPKNQEAAESIGIGLEAVIRYMKMRQIFTIIDSMQTAVQKASEIIVHMLQFSRKSSLVKTPTDPIRLIEDSLILSCNDYDLKKKYDFRNISIVREYQESLPMVQVSVNEIEQVFLNILRNAAQAISEKKSEQHAEIIVRLFQDNNYIVYEICDNGPGMPEHIRKKVFEPFFTTKDIGEGTGLGLSISYSIITIHHLGKITVDSKEGAGTTFRIALPIISENTE